MGALVCLLVGVPSANAAISAGYFSPLSGSGLSLAREGPGAATLPNGDVVVGGGYNPSFESNYGGASGAADLFNPESDAFSAIPGKYGDPAINPEAFPVGAQLPNGNIEIFGGIEGTVTFGGGAVFSPSAGGFGGFGGGAYLQTSRAYAVASPLPDGEVLIAGGINQSAGSINYLQSAELIDGVAGTGSLLTNTGGQLIDARAGAVAAPLPDGEVLIAGGFDGANYLKSAELFNPTTDTFSILGGFTPAPDQQLSTARYGAIAAPLPDGRILIAGGTNGSQYLSSAELFDPSTDTFTPLSESLTTARFGAAAAALPDGRILISGGCNSLCSSQTAGTPGLLSSAELFSSWPEAAGAGGDFGVHQLNTPSAVRSVLVRNVGAQTLRITGASLAGSDTGDFAIVSDACSGATLELHQQCAIGVRFSPTAAGSRSAMIDLSDNAPGTSTLTLSGTGQPANPGAAGQNGTSGAAGAAGAAGAGGTAGLNGTAGAPGTQGPRGAAGADGAIELLTCKPLRNGHGQQCTSKLVSGSVSFLARAARASVSRGGRVYASGSLTARGKTLRLELLVRIPLRRGHYVLSARYPVGTAVRVVRQPLVLR